MTSKKNLAKEALKHPELFTPAELSYFELWLKKRKEKKQAKKSRIRLALERIFLL
jgi:hypothetical protein